MRGICRAANVWANLLRANSDRRRHSVALDTVVVSSTYFIAICPWRHAQAVLVQRSVKHGRFLSQCYLFNMIAQLPALAKRASILLMAATVFGGIGNPANAQNPPLLFPDCFVSCPRFAIAIAYNEGRASPARRLKLTSKSPASDGPDLILMLMVATDSGVTGQAILTHATSQPLALRYQVTGTFTRDTAAPADPAHQHIDLSGYPIIRWNPRAGVGPALPQSFKASVDLDTRSSGGVARYQYREGFGAWRSVQQDVVKSE
jgi:Domain of unknown function (DUF1842)